MFQVKKEAQDKCCETGMFSDALQHKSWSKQCILMAFFLLMMPSVVEAKNREGDKITLPDELLYQGRPIEAACFHDLLRLRKGQSSISLEDCKRPTTIGSPDTPPRTKHNIYNATQSIKHLPRGFIGYHYYLYGNICDDKELGNCEHRFAAYKYLGKMYGKPVILIADETRTEWHGDGDRYVVNVSGLNLVQVERKNDTLNVVKNFGQSVGLNGRLEDNAYISGNKIYFEAQLCPSDYAKLAGDAEDVDRLLKCGTKSPLGQNSDRAIFENDELKAVTLHYHSSYMDASNKIDYSDMPMQRCFDVIHQGYVDAGANNQLCRHKKIAYPFISHADMALDANGVTRLIFNMKRCKDATK